MAAPVIVDAARRHGVADNAMLHAFGNPIKVHRADDRGLVMVVGPARDGALLEIGWVPASDGPGVIVHAMPARAKFL